MPCSNASDGAGGGRAARAGTLLAAVVLAACAAGERGGIEQAGLQRSDGRVELVLAVRLAPALREGLERGVPLNFRIEVSAGGGAGKATGNCATCR